MGLFHSPRERGTVARYGMAVTLVAATLVVRLWLDPILGEHVPFSLFFPAIIVSSWFLGSGPGLTAVVLSLIAADWFIVQPRGSFRITQMGSGLGLGIHAILGLTICWYGQVTRAARRRLENSLREAQRLEQEYQTLFELSVIGQAEVDTQTGRFVRANSRFCEVIGYTAHELSELSFLDLTHPMDRASVQDAADRLTKGEVPMIELEKRCICKNGQTIEARVSAALKRDISGQPQRLVAAIRDITPRKQAEQALRKAQDQLQRGLAERTTELEDEQRRFEDFCSSIAHDLRAPLRAMHTFATLLAERFAGQLPDEGKVYCQRLASSASRMDRLLLDLLEYGRVSSGDYETTIVNTESLVQEVVNAVRQWSSAGDGEIQIASPLPPLRANEGLLHKVVENLLANGLKFNRPGTRPLVRVLAEQHGDRVRLCVIDNGRGIPKEHQQQIFGVFQRLDQHDPAATGIGLAIVRAAAERMKGSVGVDSEVGRGSKFWIELPSQ